jgi:glycosyltransferase involved in cell wall biosynthesis
MRRADAVTVISLALVHEAARRGVPRSRIVHAPNGVDTIAFRPVEPDAALVRQHGLDGKIVFGFLGSFNGYEGLEVLLQALAKLLTAVPHARLILVGDGEVQAAVRAEARRLGVTSQVVFAGSVSHDETRSWYSVCDVLVYPRCADRVTDMTTPLKPLEAMAMGKCVVASDVGGLRELVRSGDTGVLCAAGDSEALVQAFTDLARQPHRRAALGAAARRWVCEARDWRAVVAAHARAYEIALGRRAVHVPDVTPDPALTVAE